jgi:hypothetical protein
MPMCCVVHWEGCWALYMSDEPLCYVCCDLSSVDVCLDFEYYIVGM